MKTFPKDVRRNFFIKSFPFLFPFFGFSMLRYFLVHEVSLRMCLSLGIVYGNKGAGVGVIGVLGDLRV